MGVKEAVVARFREIFDQRNMRPNELAYRSGVTPSTVYSMLYGRRREVAIHLIKKLCGGLDMSLGAFFSARVFDEIEAADQIGRYKGYMSWKYDDRWKKLKTGVKVRFFVHYK